MQTEVIMAGFGGQGLMMIGKLLALAGLEENKEVTWLPSYGPEMRGGTANCTVVISDRPIGSPLIPSPHSAIVMNRPSHDKFAPLIRSGAGRSEIARAANRIQFELNPHPAGQLEHNVPMLNGESLSGVQHKYDETMLFFPSQGIELLTYHIFVSKDITILGVDFRISGYFHF